MDITRIPVIMRSKGWRNGARLMEIWFSRPVNSDPAAGVPDAATIRMDSWALTFERAAEVYRRMVAQPVWMGDEARRRIARWLRTQGVVGPGTMTFGNMARTAPQLDGEAIWQESVGGLFDPLDDMYAALGRFVFRVVVAGTVVPTSVPVPSMTRSERPRTGAPRHEVRIAQVGIYVWDSYDFNGDQPLGFWSANDVARGPITPAYEYVGNSDFRSWRSSNGRGGDFRVMSDVKVLQRTPPDTFLLPAEVTEGALVGAP